MQLSGWHLYMAVRNLELHATNDADDASVYGYASVCTSNFHFLGFFLMQYLLN